MNDDIIRFFSRSTHCTPEVLHNIVFDIDALCSALKLERKCLGFGSLEQPKLCVYGALPLQFLNDDNECVEVKLPMQIWMSHEYPIEPPTIYLLSTAEVLRSESSFAINNNLQDHNDHCSMSCSCDCPDNTIYEVSNAPELCPYKVLIHCNHPNVDPTGLCYCSELARWHPIHSSLCNVIQCLGHEIEESEVCPLCYVGCTSSAPNNNLSKHFTNYKNYNNRSQHSYQNTQRITSSVKSKEGYIETIMSPLLQRVELQESKFNEAEGENAKCIICYEPRSVVLIPCGHYCLCESCATNVQECPLCRTRIKVRQHVIDSNEYRCLNVSNMFNRLVLLSSAVTTTLKKLY